MSNFDFCADARLIARDMGELGWVEWKTRIEDAIADGSTGTEILMALHWIMGKIRQSEICLPEPLAAKIDTFLKSANSLLA